MTTKELAEGFMIAIAETADVNGLSTTDEVQQFENELDGAIADGLDAAWQRAQQKEWDAEKAEEERDRRENEEARRFERGYP